MAKPRLRALSCISSHISSNKSKTFCQTASKLQTICNNSCQLSVQSSATNPNLTFYWCWQQWPLIHKLAFLNKMKDFTSYLSDTYFKFKTCDAGDYRVLGNCGPKVFAFCSKNMSASDFFSILGAHQMWSFWWNGPLKVFGHTLWSVPSW